MKKTIIVTVILLFFVFQFSYGQDHDNTSSPENTWKRFHALLYEMDYKYDLFRPDDYLRFDTEDFSNMNEFLEKLYNDDKSNTNTSDNPGTSRSMSLIFGGKPETDSLTFLNFGDQLASVLDGLQEKIPYNQRLQERFQKTEENWNFVATSLLKTDPSYLTKSIPYDLEDGPEINEMATLIQTISESGLDRDQEEKFKNLYSKILTAVFRSFDGYLTGNKLRNARGNYSIIVVPMPCPNMDIYNKTMDLIEATLKDIKNERHEELLLIKSSYGVGNMNQDHPMVKEYNSTLERFESTYDSRYFKLIKKTPYAVSTPYFVLFKGSRVLRCGFIIDYVGKVNSLLDLVEH